MTILLTPLWQDWLPVSILVVMISVGLVSIAYAIGKALGNEDVIGWAKNEIYQAIGSAFFIGVALAFLVTMNIIVFALLGSGGFDCGLDSCTYTIDKIIPSAQTASFANTIRETKICDAVNPCQIAIASDRMDGIHDIVRYYMADKIVPYGILGLASSTFISFKIVKFAPLSAAELLRESYGAMFEILTTLLVMTKAHVIFLAMIKGALFPLFLVGGIILRSVSFLRGIGGLLIAIALGLFFVYPMMIILTTLVISPDADNFPTLFSDYTRFTSTTEAEDTRFTASIPDSSANIIVKTFDVPFSESLLRDTDTVVEYYSGNDPNLRSILRIKTYEVNGKTYDMISYYLFNIVQPGGFVDNTAFLTVWIVIQSILVIYSTVIFIKTTSPFFGGDVDIGLFARLL